MPLLLYIASVRVLYQGNRKQSWDNDTYFRDVFIYFILNMLIHNELFCVAYNYCSICLFVFYCFSCTFSLSRYIYFQVYITSQCYARVPQFGSGFYFPNLKQLSLFTMGMRYKVYVEASLGLIYAPLTWVTLILSASSSFVLSIQLLYLY